MTSTLLPILPAIYDVLFNFAESDGFWANLETAFGTGYDVVKATQLRQQWKSRNFSQLPPIEVLSDEVLGTANGAYSSSKNKIYLSASFLNTASSASIVNVILQEIGHYVDAQINRVDTVGDEGEYFSALVRGVDLTAQEIARITTENDFANITITGNDVPVEKSAPTILTVNTTADQNDGNADNGLSLRDAILIANANPNTEYEIHLTGGLTYTLTSNGVNEDAGKTGDLDIKSRNNVLYIGAFNGQKATIDASGLLNSDRVFHVLSGGALSLQNVVVTGGITSSSGAGISVNATGVLDLYNTTVSGNKALGSSSNGGGIQNRGFVYLRQGSVVSNNIASGSSYQEGGGVYNSGGTLIAINSTINNNQGGVYGGGILSVAGSLTLINTTVSGNSAGNGGGIRNNGTSIALINTTVSGNNASYAGGGIYSSGDTFNLINSTITNNTVVDTQFVGRGGGGIYSLSTTFFLKNTIVAGNIDNTTNGFDLLSSGLSGAIFNGNNYNLIGDLTGAKGTIGTGTDIVNSNPGLAPLANYGGLTLTHALLAGSPAINAGNNSLILIDSEDIDGDGDTTEQIPFDQRGTGFNRIFGGTVDIGAFEEQGTIVVISLAVSPASVTEDGTSNLVYTFTRSGVTINPLTVNYTLGGTATLNTDYTRSGTTNTVTFAANSSTATITVDPTADTTVEPDETVILTLASGTGYTIGTTTPVTGTITNDDVTLPSITLTVSPASVTEDGTSNLIYTFTRSGVTTNPLTVNYTLGGTATLNTDYTRTGTNNTVTFAAGSSTATVTVNPTADTIVESNETVILTLAAGTGYTIGTPNAATGTINNDDVSQLSINNITVVEGQDSNAILTVTVNNPNPQPISVNYTTAPINATANVDYTSKTGTLTIAANTSTATISIPILNDNLNEANETFAINLSNPVNATLTNNQGIVTISDTLTANVTTTLPANVENLTLTGTANINGTGNTLNNIITGNSGNNILNGATGIDTLIGGLGNDTYQVDTTTDTITENANQGTDTVESSVTYTLGNNLENLTLTGTTNINGTGNTLNNIITGNSGNNILNGSDGNDTLIGGTGNDTLTGGAGGDQFTFNNRNEGIDTITDFLSSQGDKIAVSAAGFGGGLAAGVAITAAQFVLGTTALNASNRFIYNTITGGLFFDGDGTGTLAAIQIATLSSKPTLTASDILVLV
ncbi:beta strand repeat-containing protein [Microcystis aeruginosa]|uniref:beta strand repeat-containing protein n=1 Tax=Microcystis aeruginosa TaxID=1126 RepID=UPI00232D3AFF|nr:Calx-beta domain-containing protein [Microcystis aeruginosa]MDB9390714.1 Calx-beta domain-containing protein [Microcystis aeruginosa CS-579]